jgi:superfamily I DNA/RNA helicase
MSVKEAHMILGAISELPFPVGRRLLCNVLQGNGSDKQVSRHKFSKLKCFGTMAFTDDELAEVIDKLLLNKFIDYESLRGNRFVKVIGLTRKGAQELKNPTLKEIPATRYELATPTESEKKLISEFSFFLDTLNENQRHAVVTQSDNVLCVAGAGSGKTTVLTKRIEFLVKFMGVDPKRILAITFTRKARTQMMDRLPLNDIRIETFNSFCEKILRKHTHVIYGREIRVISYGEKIRILNSALAKSNIEMDRAIYLYFSPSQRKLKTSEQLARVFLNDMYFIVDYYKSKGQEVQPFYEDAKDKMASQMAYKVCKFIEASLIKHGLRTFTDQVIEALRIFRQHKQLIPEFEHVLVDEYQDVNDLQIDLLKTLSPKSTFAVGDPRQSIFGWRGSKVKYILDFQEKNPDASVISLTTNYRSTGQIVNFINETIRNMRMPDLEAAAEGKKDIHLIGFDSEASEREFVVQKILGSSNSPGEIFVLGRTNKQLKELSKVMHERQIDHITRSEDDKPQPLKDAVTLSTIHAIKGLEAELVFVLGCTSNNFPCKSTDHPVIDMVKVEDYDREEEERRLFYVALSRAKESLYLTHSGTKPTYYITEKMREQLNLKKTTSKASSVFTSGSKITGTRLAGSKATGNIEARLRTWRKEISQVMNVPAYIIFNDKTLTDLTDKMPSSKQELIQVNGFGPAKVDRYGEAVLKILN